MTLKHIAVLYFAGRREAAKKRVQRLKRASLIKERARLPWEPAILHLTRGGLNALREYDDTSPNAVVVGTLGKRPQVTDQTLRHEIDVTDVKAALCAALATRSDLRLVDFTTWPSRMEFRANVKAAGSVLSRRVTVRPDGFLDVYSLTTRRNHRFFLEVDRSTETLDRIVAKANCYRDYYRSGGFALRQGGSDHAYGEFPFVVLLVVRSAARRDNIARRLLALAPPILSQVWIATLAALLYDPLGKTWLPPIALRRASPTGEVLPMHALLG